ncbi:MAG: hypothetical protein NZ928_03675 [Endomicrobia bacterium]|nr:hypothetical protein [Endomicrobiia bacterium]MCX7940147.1 hypothetical protein [Endomicrobiia bacterium]MDW8056115.1 hypothetical protein [Elusimicrobiota bacterium]
MQKNLLEKILNSNKIHFTFSEKNFIKESFDILSIFLPDIGKFFYEKFVKATKNSKSKFEAKNKFIDEVLMLRYPVSYTKIKKLKKYKIGLTLEFDENKLNLAEKDVKFIKNVVNKI